MLEVKVRKRRTKGGERLEFYRDTCPYCRQHHNWDAGPVGISDAEVRENLREVELPCSGEKVVLTMRPKPEGADWTGIAHKDIKLGAKDQKRLGIPASIKINPYDNPLMRNKKGGRNG